MAGLCIGCVPDQPLVFKQVTQAEISATPEGEVYVRGTALFHNPNKVAMTLREINLEVFLDDKKSAQVVQQMKARIPARADFSLPLAVQLNVREESFVKNLLGFLGGKKYTVRYAGYVRVRVNGITVKVPVQHKEEVRLKIGTGR